MLLQVEHVSSVRPVCLVPLIARGVCRARRVVLPQLVHTVLLAGLPRCVVCVLLARVDLFSMVHLLTMEKLIIVKQESIPLCMADLSHARIARPGDMQAVPMAHNHAYDVRKDGVRGKVRRFVPSVLAARLYTMAPNRVVS